MKSMVWVYKLFKAGALLSMSAMIAVVTLQVFARYFLDATPHWTEEAARMLFIYAVAFGTAIGIKNGDFIRLDLIGKYLTPAMDRLLDLVTDVAVVLFAFLLVVSSINFVRLGMDELSPALELTMGFIFISLAIIGLAVFLFTITKLVQSIKDKF